MHHPQPAPIYMFEIENPIISLDNKVTWSMTLNFKIDTNFRSNVSQQQQKQNKKIASSSPCDGSMSQISLFLFTNLMFSDKTQKRKPDKTINLKETKLIIIKK